MTCTTEEPLALAADIAERDTLKELLRRYISLDLSISYPFPSEHKHLTVSILFDGEVIASEGLPVHRL